MGRFAYAALLPGLINAGWLSTSDAGYVGAANLLGYLIGALLAGRAERWLGARVLINASTVLIALGFFVSTWDAPVWWFGLWRLIAGVTGAFLIVVVPSLVATRLPQHLRKRGATWIFTGIGIGVVLSATLVPALVHRGLPLAWLALGLISLLPVALAWVRWPRVTLAADGAGAGPRPGVAPVLWLVYLAYALDATGFVPHTVFWVDYLEHHRHLSSFAGGVQWAVLGVGAISGPFIAGALARRFGWHTAMTTALALKGCGVWLPMLVPGLAAITASSFLVGAMIPAMVASTAGLVGELAGPAGQTMAWGRATALFALSQAGAAYAMAPIYAHSDSGNLIFYIGGSALFLGVLLLLVAALLRRRRDPAVTASAGSEV